MMFTALVILFLIIDLAAVAAWSHRQGRKYEKRRHTWPYNPDWP